jgi:hypothetical protein
VSAGGSGKGRGRAQVQAQAVGWPSYEYVDRDSGKHYSSKRDGQTVSQTDSQTDRQRERKRAFLKRLLHDDGGGTCSTAKLFNSIGSPALSDSAQACVMRYRAIDIGSLCTQSTAASFLCSPLPCIWWSSFIKSFVCHVYVLPRVLCFSVARVHRLSSLQTPSDKGLEQSLSGH